MLCSPDNARKHGLMGVAYIIKQAQISRIMENQ